MVTEHSTEKELYKLFNTFFLNSDIPIHIKCVELYNDYNPSTDEVVTYKYKIQMEIKNKSYTYDGWCYEEDLKQIALGIFSHWLLDNMEIYKGPSTAWYNMYNCYGNIIEQE